MRLTLLVLAINAEKELARILPELAPIADELVIGIDDTTTDETARIARQFTAKVHPVPHEGFRGRGRPDDLNAVECMLTYCSGEWLLRIDQDETLSPHWQDRAYVDALLRERSATQYWIPRRLVVPPGDRYISSGRWHPDYQLRLYRNIASLIEFNRHPHERPRVAGERRLLTDSCIFHWDPIWYDRSHRDRKVEFYRDLGYPKEEYFLHDEEMFETRPLDYVYPQASQITGDAHGGPFQAAIELLDQPEVMRVGKPEPVLIGTGNISSRTFRPSSTFVRPANVLLSGHWYNEDGGIYRWDIDRQDLPRLLRPGESAACFLTVRAPEIPGNYIFQPDLVEEAVAWFSSHCEIPKYPVRVA
jgi:glycosyltransferase involved in cell wall biosynthesis